MGERNERKRQGRLHLRVAQGRMRTDRGRSINIQTKLPLSSLVRARYDRPMS